MITTIRASRFLALTCLLGLAACGGGNDDAPAPPAPPPPPSGTVIGPTGGTVTGPSGANVVIPAGALAAETRILIEQSAAGAPPLPAGYTSSGLTFQFTPHGTTFALPVTMTLPFDPTTVTGSATPVFLKTNAQNLWEEVPNAAFSSTSVTAQVTSFSGARVAVPPPLATVRVVRSWSLRHLLGDALVEEELAADTVDTDVTEEVELGPADFDDTFIDEDTGLPIPADGLATAFVQSTRDGNTYIVSAEAPKGNAASATDPIGGVSRLVQYQTFRKDAADATYSFTITSASVQLIDGNGILGRICPAGLGRGGDVSDEIICDLQRAFVELDVMAYQLGEPTFFRTSGVASAFGSAGKYSADAWSTERSRVPLWNKDSHFLEFIEDFNGPSGDFLLELEEPITHTIDLSSVNVGEEFTVRATAKASASNRAAGVVSGQGAEFETAAQAWLRDPVEIGGTRVVTTGLTPIDTPTPVVEPEEDGRPVPPAPCVPGPGPDPAAGTLQFSAATFTQSESGNPPTVRVSRVGGNAGAVTATFTTSDGTAVAGVDYTAVNTSVFFGAGDAETRVLEVPAIQDAAGGEPDRTVNLTLSEPGGCAGLGAQTTAVLTITDDDAPPPPTLFTVGGTVTGLGANPMVLENHRGMFLEVAANGPFTFSQLPTPSGSSYFVRVFNQPRNALGFQTQQCTVTNGTGVFGNANVDDVVVTCIDL